MIWMAAIIAAIGLTLYAFGRSQRIQRIGEIAYFAGLLAFLLGFPETIHLVRFLRF